jgi:hypothetical protein
MAWSTDRVRIGFCSAVPGIALIFSVTVVLLLFSSLGFAQHTYYISKTLGNDSNASTQAQSKSTPWVHVPGMAGCTGNCASYTPRAGDAFILHGGDTWGTADLPLEIDQNGTGQCVTTANASCIYVGVDTTWYNSSVCGGSFCRPIFDQQLTVETSWYAIVYLYGEYITLDNIEVKGQRTSGGAATPVMTSVGVGGGGDVIEHMYYHGWEHSASGDSDNSQVLSSSGGSAPNIAHDNVIDGGDTLAATAVSGNPCGSPDGICQGMNVGIQGKWTQVYNNVIANVTNGCLCSFDIMHDNFIGPVWLGYTGGHRNGVQQAAPATQAWGIVYNNVMTKVQNGGMGGLWLQQGGASSGVTTYVFNNILFAGTGTGAGTGEGLQFGQKSGGMSFYAFNNTIEGKINLYDANGSSVSHAINNHCIGTTDCVNNETGWTSTETTNLPQCLGTGAGCSNADASSHFDQYTDSQTYADSPVASTNSTVGAGTDEASLCSTISGLNAAAATACLSSTSYTCSYNTTNHTVSCPGLAPNARPASAAWDIGAYLYNTGDSPPNPPSGLTAVVN